MVGAARPRLHLSTPRGWINDAHGVVWHEGGYHVFFQYVPDAAAWAPGCHWGHLAGPDLVSWDLDADPDIALAPGDGDLGCWSGALVLDGDRPTILYTSVPDEYADRKDSSIALALGDRHLRTWTKVTPPVLEAPDGVSEFRDPSVQRDGTGWRMVVGCRREGEAAALLFRSPDLREWSAAEVLCRRRADPADEVQTGEAWECVQFIELDGVWVLIVSAWTDRMVEDGVVYAVGDFDGAIFTPRSWRRLDHGGALYATTTFRDADDRWCALSWVREAEPPVAVRTRAGALSLAHRLAVDGDRLTITAHPDLDRLPGADLPLDGPLPRQFDLHLTVRSRTVIAGLVLEPDAGHLLVGTGSTEPRRMPVPAGTLVRVVLDEDIAEVFAGGEVAVLRIPDRTDRLTGVDADARLRALETPSGD